ncbi:hypothetical protein [Ralstonia pseudosolanacearum]|uniref:hypothetical protein n=1 Tax=Ralstonia pseudosolanacearum TaxID=1310165 RepID=UPI003221A3CA
MVDIPDSELIVLFIFNDFSVVPGAGCRVAGGGWRVIVWFGFESLGVMRFWT